MSTGRTATGTNPYFKTAGTLGGDPPAETPRQQAERKPQAPSVMQTSFSQQESAQSYRQQELAYGRQQEPEYGRQGYRQQETVREWYPEPVREQPQRPAAGHYPVNFGFYLFNFVAGLLHWSRIPLLIYLALNTAIMGAVCTWIFQLPFGWGMLCGLILYMASVNVALSPIGEWILRSQNACRKIDRMEDVDRIYPIFREVYDRARRECPHISKRIRLYIVEQGSQNAFATGRNTICITRGLLEMPDEQIEAILAHEFGHLAYMDTDITLVVGVGNLIITGACMAVQLVIALLHLLLALMISGSEADSKLERGCSAVMRFLSLGVIGSIMKLWTWIGILLCMKTNRKREYEADKFAWKIGYGRELQDALDMIADDYPSGFFSNLQRSHPNGSARVRHLEELDRTA